MSLQICEGQVGECHMTNLNLIIVVCPFQIFCEVAYLASSRGDILDGIEKFIDDLTVLPPSIWDLNVRLDPPRTTVSLVCDENCLYQTKS